MHWANIVTGIGAVATTAGIVAGAVLAALYGRRGSVSVSASAYETPYGFVVTARPSVKAVGLFRLRFKEQEGVIVRLTEMYAESGELKEGRSWTGTGAYDDQYVDAGEELLTSVVFPPVIVAPSVVGWIVFLGVTATTRLIKLRTARWADQYFVLRPDAGKVP